MSVLYCHVADSYVNVLVCLAMCQCYWKHTCLSYYDVIFFMLFIIIYLKYDNYTIPVLLGNVNMHGHAVMGK